MPLQQPDPDVLRRARHGDERAFETIVQMYQTPLFNYVARVLGGDRALAEDICQEVFIRVHRSLARFDHRCLFTTWLFQVAKHRVVDELRARERRGKPTLELGAVPHLALVARPSIRSRRWTWCGRRWARSTPTCGWRCCSAT